MSRLIYGALIAVILGLGVALFLVDRDRTGLRDQLAVEVQAHLETQGNYAAAQATAQQKAQDNLDRVYVEQSRATEEIHDMFEKRLADARADYARRLRDAAQAQRATAAGGAGAAGVPQLPAAAPGSVEETDHRLLLATEQAIQLDELISWVEAQNKVAPD